MNRLSQRLSVHVCARALSACLAAGLSGTTTAQIIIGQTAGFTGAVAATVKETTEGAKLYIDSVNSKGGVNGQQIEIVSMDDKFDPKTAAANARALIVDRQAVALFLTRGTPDRKSVV